LVLIIALCFRSDTRPDSLTGIAYPAGDTLFRNVSHGNPIAELIKKWL
jgi:hypothetical protein